MKAPEREDMTKSKLRRAIGLMSGTSADGIDAALIETNGEDIVRPLAWATRDYDADLRTRILEAMKAALHWFPGTPRPVLLDDVEQALTEAQADLVRTLLRDQGVHDADVVGFHGQTVLHRSTERRTVQLGDGALMAKLTGTDVVFDFRSADIAAGGEGAPLVPLYHRALAARLDKPVAVLNIGGVANVTYVGLDSSVLAFDTGPGNALVDDWMRIHRGSNMDEGGAFAATGCVSEECLRRLLDHPYFTRRPPKSLDRHDFSLAAVDGLSPADGAATLTAFTAAAVAKGLRHFPSPSKQWLVTGGGRHNATLMAGLAARLEAPVASVESVGWRGDVMEAEAFAYLAVRSLEGLPLTLPSTTGCPQPTRGGRLARAPSRS